MRVPGRKLVRKALRPLKRGLFPGALVLGYHRVAEATWDPLGLAVGPANFAAQVDVVQQTRTFIHLRDLPSKRAAGEKLEQYAVLTFDDGYRDFMEGALPVLESRKVPATVFVATGFIGRRFWWDEVAACLSPNGGSTAPLTIRDGEQRSYNELDRPGGRSAAARQICDRMACAPEAAIASVIRQLREWRGVDDAIPDGRPMNRKELDTLSRNPLVEIGAHTVSHGCLARLPAALQKREIAESKAELETLPGVAGQTFSYPNGSLSRETPNLVRELGFSAACTSSEGTFGRRTHQFRIPRIWAPDCGQGEFETWVGHWAAGTR